MLNTNQAITLSGQSTINGTVAVNFYATIGGNTQDNFSSTIVNKELYEANKDECKKDIADFQSKVFAIQDSTK